MNTLGATLIIAGELVLIAAIADRLLFERRKRQVERFYAAFYQNRRVERFHADFYENRRKR